MKLKYKIILMIICVEIPVILFIFTNNYQSLYTSIVDKSVEYLTSQSYSNQVYISDYLELNRTQKVDETLEKIAPFMATYFSKSVKTRVQIINKQGEIIGDTHNYDEELLYEDVQDSINGYKCYILKNINGNKYIFFSSPIYVGNVTYGSIRYVYNLNNELSLLYSNTIQMTGIAIIALIISLVFSYLIAGKVVRPIVLLKEATEKVAQGNFEKVISINSGDEIDDLADTFNIMSESLDTYVHSLKEEKEKQKIFFDNVTHEIKTPLTSIIGYSDLIPRMNDDDIEECSYYINKEGKRLLALVEDILRISTIEKDDFTLQIDQCDIYEIVTEAIRTMRPRIQKAAIKITTDIQSYFVYADKRRTEEVIFNIIDNCIKHSECSNIFIRTEKTNANIVLTIEDDGLGMVSKDMNSLFVPLFKYNENEDKVYSSSGLGLSICKKVMEKQEGTIEIESYIEKGTTVKVIFKCYNYETIGK